MGVVSEPPGIAGEIDDELPDVDALLLDLPVGDAGAPVRDRQGNHRAIGKNRTGAASTG